MLTAAPSPPPVAAAPDAEPARLQPLRRLLWFYLLLWVTEGALRKWIAPGLASPLLIVRDPVLLAMYFLAWRRGVFPANFFFWFVTGLGFIALGVSVVFTDVPLAIELYGWRTNFLHLPLIFLIPRIFDGDDVRRVGFWTLACALPMAPLVFLQFVARPGSWFNAGAGGGLNGMLDAANGHIRPSGTFSFTNGLSGFSILVTAFFLWQLFETKLFPRLLWLASGGALVVLVSLSGSRSVAGATALMVAMTILIGFVQPRYWPATVKLMAVLCAVVAIGGSFAVFKQGTDVLAARFGSSEAVQHGFIGRFFDSLYKPLSTIEVAKPAGVGLGLGTNVASGIINEGKRQFLLVEGDMARIILESGPILGVTYQLMRMALAAYIGARAFGSLVQRANTLPPLMFSGIVAVLLVGEFSQPTELGFATISAGLCLAANRPRTTGNNAMPTTVRAPMPAVPAPPTVRRGRSAYAEQLHGPAAGSGNHA